MSNMSDVQWVRRNDYSYGLGTITVPTDARIVEIYAYPNGGANEGTFIGMGFRFNGDTGANYRIYNRQWHSATGNYYATVSTTETAIYPYYFHGTNNADQGLCKVVIYPRSQGSNAYKGGRLEWYDGKYFNEQYLRDGFFDWKNTVDEITSISFGSFTAAGRHSNDLMVKFIR